MLSPCLFLFSDNNDITTYPAFLTLSRRLTQTHSFRQKLRAHYPSWFVPWPWDSVFGIKGCIWRKDRKSS